MIASGFVSNKIDSTLPLESSRFKLSVSRSTAKIELTTSTINSHEKFPQPSGITANRFPAAAATQVVQALRYIL